MSDIKIKRCSCGRETVDMLTPEIDRLRAKASALVRADLARACGTAAPSSVGLTARMVRCTAALEALNGRDVGVVRTARAIIERGGVFGEADDGE